MEPFTEKGKRDKRDVQSGRRDYPTSLRKPVSCLIAAIPVETASGHGDLLAFASRWRYPTFLLLSSLLSFC